jgi:hypothetical protein
MVLFPDSLLQKMLLLAKLQTTGKSSGIYSKVAEGEKRLPGDLIYRIDNGGFNDTA